MFLDDPFVKALVIAHRLCNQFWVSTGVVINKAGATRVSRLQGLIFWVLGVGFGVVELP